jgi:hypothetical protein
MMASITPVTYYNGIAWLATTLPNGTRTVQPLRRDGSGTLVTRTVIRYYRRPGRPHANGI